MAQEWTDNALNRVTQEKLIAVAGQGDRLSGRTGTLMYMVRWLQLQSATNKALKLEDWHLDILNPSL